MTILEELTTNKLQSTWAKIEEKCGTPTVTAAPARTSISSDVVRSETTIVENVVKRLDVYWIRLATYAAVLVKQTAIGIVLVECVDVLRVF